MDRLRRRLAEIALATLAAGCTAPGVPSDGGATDAAGGDLAAACAPACGGATPFCNATRHCVGCGRDADCAIGSRCLVVSDSEARCAIGCSDDGRCPAGEHCCAGACTDLANDPGNCGACGKACSAAHASASCAAGQCSAAACDPGWGDCDGQPGDGCEANLRVDPASCTACGMQCALAHAVQACADGCYLAACQFGFADCDASEADGCETPVGTDPANCGACGRSCAALPHATASCTDGNCVLGACDAGFADCDGDPNDGCEANLAFDPQNCGKCGVVCPMNAPACDSGTCGNAVLRLYGNTAPFMANSSHSPDYLLGSAVQVAQGGNLVKFGVISRSAGAHMVMALYSDTGGRPSALLAQTAVVTLNNSTQEIPPLAPVALAAGTYWILAVYDIGASVGFDQSNGAAVVQYISFNFGGALPNQIQNPTTYMGQQFNYYIGVQ